MELEYPTVLLNVHVTAGANSFGDISFIIEFQNECCLFLALRFVYAFVGMHCMQMSKGIVLPPRYICVYRSRSTRVPVVPHLQASRTIVDSAPHYTQYLFCL